ncbi:hypothetical protein PENSPDRAFT_671533 [Peniophora sp. CONT]|nr:hypothetical protein PENSPDRAFT_671533 [Peniophora sp. CONT]
MAEPFALAVGGAISTHVRLVNIGALLELIASLTIIGYIKGRSMNQCSLQPSSDDAEQVPKLGMLVSEPASEVSSFRPSESAGPSGRADGLSPGAIDCTPKHTKLPASRTAGIVPARCRQPTNQLHVNIKWTKFPVARISDSLADKSRQSRSSILTICLDLCRSAAGGRVEAVTQGQTRAAESARFSLPHFSLTSGMSSNADPLRLDNAGRWELVGRIMEELRDDCTPPAPGAVPDAFNTLEARYEVIERAADVTWEMLIERTPNLLELLEVTRDYVPEPLPDDHTLEEADAAIALAMEGPEVDFFAPVIVRPGIPKPSSYRIVLMNLPDITPDTVMAELDEVYELHRLERGDSMACGVTARTTGNYWAFDEKGRVEYTQEGPKPGWALFLGHLCAYTRANRGNFWTPPRLDGLCPWKERWNRITL